MFASFQTLAFYVCALLPCFAVSKIGKCVSEGASTTDDNLFAFYGKKIKHDFLMSGKTKYVEASTEKNRMIHAITRDTCKHTHTQYLFQLFVLIAVA